jgi:serine/threonine-protein kinase
MHVRLDPIPPTHLDPSIPEGLERIILRAMEKLPFARFQSAGAMREELEAFAAELHTPPAPGVQEEEPPRSLLEKGKAVAAEYWNGLSLPSLVTGVLCALLVTVVLGLGILADAILTERRDPAHMKIPELVGHEYAAAVSVLDPSVYDVSITFVDDDARQGRIVKQTPEAGSVEKIKEGERTAIHLTVACRSLPPTMPDLRRMVYSEIEEILRAYDCEVIVIEQPHAYFGEGEIIATLPAAGEKTTHRITVYVSSGWQKNE